MTRADTLDELETIEINTADVIDAMKTNAYNQDRSHPRTITVREMGGGNTGIEISPEAFVVGHEEGSAKRWHSDYTPPEKSETEYLFEKYASEDTTWEEWWTECIEEWEGRIRAAVKNTDSITFRDPPRGARFVSIPVRTVDE